MSGESTLESEVPTSRREVLKRSAVAPLGLGLGFRARGDGTGSGTRAEAQEEPGLQYYELVVPSRGVVRDDYVNKFLFTTALRRRTDELPFDGCFDDTEDQVERRFGEGAFVYDGVLVDAAETFQLFGDDDATQRLREILEGQGLEFPDAIAGNIGAIVGTRIYAPVATGKLPTTEGYRAVGGEQCAGDHVRLRVHELPNEITE